MMQVKSAASTHLRGSKPHKLQLSICESNNSDIAKEKTWD